MPNKNTNIKTKANTVALAWANLAQGDTFAGMTLQQFTQNIAGTDAQVANLANLRAQYAGGAKQSEVLHEQLKATTQAVVNGVRADMAKHGPDSPLYKTMGYVPVSERATGLVRKKSTTGTSGAGGTTDTTGTGTQTAGAPAAASVSVKS
jgi:hypothetical protein